MAEAKKRTIIDALAEDLSYLTSEEDRQNRINEYKLMAMESLDPSEHQQAFKNIDAAAMQWQKNQGNTVIERNADSFLKRLAGVDKRHGDQEWGAQVAADIARPALILGAGGALAPVTGGLSVPAAMALAGILGANQAIHDDMSAQGKEWKPVYGLDEIDGGMAAKAAVMGGLDAFGGVGKLAGLRNAAKLKNFGLVPGLGAASSGAMKLLGGDALETGALALGKGVLPGGLSEQAIEGAAKAAGNTFSRVGTRDMQLNALQNVISGITERGLDRQYDGQMDDSTSALSGGVISDAILGAGIPMAINLGEKSFNKLIGKGFQAGPTRGDIEGAVRQMGRDSNLMVDKDRTALAAQLDTLSQAVTDKFVRVQEQLKTATGADKERLLLEDEMLRNQLTALGQARQRTSAELEQLAAAQREAVGQNLTPAELLAQATRRQLQAGDVTNADALAQTAAVSGPRAQAEIQRGLTTPIGDDPVETALQARIAETVGLAPRKDDAGVDVSNFIFKEQMQQHAAVQDNLRNRELQDIYDRLLSPTPVDDVSTDPVYFSPDGQRLVTADGRTVARDYAALAAQRAEVERLLAGNFAPDDSTTGASYFDPSGQRLVTQQELDGEYRRLDQQQSDARGQLLSLLQTQAAIKKRRDELLSGLGGAGTRADADTGYWSADGQQLMSELDSQASIVQARIDQLLTGRETSTPDTRYWSADGQSLKTETQVAIENAMRTSSTTEPEEARYWSADGQRLLTQADSQADLAAAKVIRDAVDGAPAPTQDPGPTPLQQVIDELTGVSRPPQARPNFIEREAIGKALDQRAADNKAAAKVIRDAVDGVPAPTQDPGPTPLQQVIDELTGVSRPPQARPNFVEREAISKALDQRAADNKILRDRLIGDMRLLGSTQGDILSVNDAKKILGLGKKDIEPVLSLFKQADILTNEKYATQTATLAKYETRKKLNAADKNALVGVLKTVNERIPQLAAEMKALRAKGATPDRYASVLSEYNKLSGMRSTLMEYQAKFAGAFEVTGMGSTLGNVRISPAEYIKNKEFQTLLTDPSVEAALNSSIRSDTGFNYVGTPEQAERAAALMMRPLIQGAEKLDATLARMLPDSNFGLAKNAQTLGDLTSMLVHGLRRSTDSLPADHRVLFDNALDELGRINQNYLDPARQVLLRGIDMKPSKVEERGIMKLFMENKLADVVGGRVNLEQYGISRFAEQIQAIAKLKNELPDVFGLAKRDTFHIQRKDYEPRALGGWDDDVYEEVLDQRSRTKEDARLLDVPYFEAAMRYFSSMTRRNVFDPRQIAEVIDTTTGKPVPLTPEGKIDYSAATGPLKYRYVAKENGFLRNLSVLYKQAQETNRPLADTIEFMRDQLTHKGIFDTNNLFNKAGATYRRTVTEAVMSWNVSSVWRSFPDLFLTGVDVDTLTKGVNYTFANSEATRQRMLRLGLSSSHESIVHTAEREAVVKDRLNPQQIGETKLREFTVNALAEKYSAQYGIPADDIFTKDNAMARNLRAAIRREISNTMGSIDPLQRRPMFYNRVMGTMGGFLMDSSLQEKQVLFGLGAQALRGDADAAKRLMRYGAVKVALGGSNAIMDPKLMGLIAGVATTFPQFANAAAWMQGEYDKYSGGVAAPAYAAAGLDPKGMVNPIIDIPFLKLTDIPGAHAMFMAALDDAKAGDFGSMGQFLTSGSIGQVNGTLMYAFADYLTAALGYGKIPIPGMPMVFRGVKEAMNLAKPGGVYEYNNQLLQQTPLNAVANTVFTGDAQEAAARSQQDIYKILANAAAASGATADDLSLALIRPEFKALLQQYITRRPYLFDPSMDYTAKEAFILDKIKDKLNNSDDEQALKRSVKRLLRLGKEAQMTGNAGATQAVQQMIQEKLTRIERDYGEDSQSVMASILKSYDDTYGGDY